VINAVAKIERLLRTDVRVRQAVGIICRQLGVESRNPQDTHRNEFPRTINISEINGFSRSKAEIGGSPLEVTNGRVSAEGAGFDRG
jgi:hypothetical protein